MDTRKLKRRSPCHWVVEAQGRMNVPVMIFADLELVREMDEKVLEQATNVASLPGIVGGSFAMPDAHWGYGFPIGGVAAFDPEQGGIVSAGGVGFDIACGVRSLTTGLTSGDIESVKDHLADMFAKRVPAGVGSTGKIKLHGREMDDMLTAGAQWAVARGYGGEADLERIEERGRVEGAEPKYVSDHAKERLTDQIGTLGSGNHYLEVQKIVEIFDAAAAQAFGLAQDEIVVSIHCGSRGLGHQIGTDFLPRMVKGARAEGIDLAEKELACAPIRSNLGQQYLGAMNCGINCATANRQVLTHLVRQVFDTVLPKAALDVLYDVSHNTCKLEEHMVAGDKRELYVHRKGATRAFGPGHASLPDDLSEVGQPVLIGGTMGTASYILAGTAEGMSLSFGSCCHGAGRAMSRKQATKRWHGRDVIRFLAERGIVIRGASLRGVAEEAPQAYKDVTSVVDVTEKAGLARKVAKLEPMICVKG